MYSTTTTFGKTNARVAGITLCICVVLWPMHAPAAAETSPPSAAAESKPTFDVSEYRVLGNTALPAVGVERAVYAFLGERKTLDDVEQARQALERAYHDAGFGTVFVDIPEQSTEGGIVRLRVTEGRLDRVRITGARYFSNGEIRSALPALTPGQVPNLPHVQAELAALNRATSDRSVTPLLKAGRIPGAVDLELKVNDELPLHGSVEVNDRYTADTTHTRVNGSLSYNNLFQRQHILSFQYQTAPQEREEVEAFVGSYIFKIPAWRNTTFALYAVDSTTDVAALGTLSVIGNGNIYGARAIRSLPDGAGYFHSLALGVDYKDFLENIHLDSEQVLATPIRYMNWSIMYSGTLRGNISTTISELGANLGVRGLVNDASQFADKRFHGAANYFYLRGALQQAVRIPWNFQLYGRLTGQITDDPLVSNEQLAVGGADTVRGFPESGQLGDYGVHGSFELRNAWLSKPLKLSPDFSYLFAFYDAGLGVIVDPLPAQDPRFNLSSYGVGARIGAWYGFDLALDWAHVLHGAGDIRRGDDRVHFSVKYIF